MALTPAFKILMFNRPSAAPLTYFRSNARAQFLFFTLYSFSLNVFRIVFVIIIII